MDAGAVVALALGIAAVLLTVFGGIIKYLLGKVTTAEASANAAQAKTAEVEKTAQARIAEAEKKADTAEALADSKNDMVQELSRQVQRLEISAEITDRMMRQLPPRQERERG